MNSEIFAEWLQRRGFNVIKTESSFWYNQGPRVYQAFPYHWKITPKKGEIKGLLKKHKILAVRFSSPHNAPFGAVSYHAIYENDKYSIDMLSKNSRKNVRRGLRDCDVRQISFEYLAEYGYDLQEDTLDRQSRGIEMNRKIWSRRCLSAKDLDGFLAWGAFIDDHLAASVITTQIDGCGYMLYQQCKRDYLSDNVNNALAFEVTRYLINDLGLKKILYGLHSLDAPPSVDVFKFRMGYDTEIVRQQVHFHPYIQPLIDIFPVSVISFLKELFPKNNTISKGEGFIRFYKDGKKSLVDQNWPENIQDKKEAYLKKYS